MSSMTRGAQRQFWPRMLRLGFAPSAGASSLLLGACLRLAMFAAAPLEDDLLLGRLEIVVVPQLLAGDDLLEVTNPVRRREVVHLQLALQPRRLEVRHL